MSDASDSACTQKGLTRPIININGRGTNGDRYMISYGKLQYSIMMLYHTITNCEEERI